MIEVNGNAYKIPGISYSKGKVIDINKHDALKLTLEIGALCNNANISVVGEKINIFSKVKSIRKCMSVLCKNNKGERFVFTKGAPDVMIKS